MPNSTTHLFVGVLAGGGYAYLANPSDDQLCRLSSCVGGIVGGFLTARLPDILDPPVHYAHRSLGHSFILNGAALLLGYSKWRRLIQQCQKLADQALEKADTDQASKWHFLAGMLAGLPMGIGSHLVLDFFTPVSLPLLF